MLMRYIIICVAVATVMAEELPVLMALPHQDERSLPLNAKPHVYQQLPQEHSFGDFLPPPVSYGAPLPVSMRRDIKSADFEIPSEDSYNDAFLHSSGQQHQTGYDHGPMETQVHKHIYVHAPPLEFEQEDDIKPRLIHQAGRKQKHYKIIFIKAPEAPNVRAPIAPPLPPQNEEKTIIYVLHKKPETHPNVLIPTPEPTKPSKPEVYFIKYKSRRQEAPVYGPPPALNEIQYRQAADEGDVFMSNQRNESAANTSLPQYAAGMEQQPAQAKFVTEAPSDIYNVSTVSNSINENVPVTTVEPITQNSLAGTTLAPIVVKSMDEIAHLPAGTYGPPKRNRFFIKRRK